MSDFAKRRFMRDLSRKMRAFVSVFWASLGEYCINNHNENSTDEIQTYNRQESFLVHNVLNQALFVFKMFVFKMIFGTAGF